MREAFRLQRQISFSLLIKPPLVLTSCALFSEIYLSYASEKAGNALSAHATTGKFLLAEAYI